MLVNLINPSVVVIGGPMATAGEHLIAGIREVVYQRSLPLATEHLQIVAVDAPASGRVSSARPRWRSGTCCRRTRSRRRAPRSPVPPPPRVEAG